MKDVRFARACSPSTTPNTKTTRIRVCHGLGSRMAKTFQLNKPECSPEVERLLQAGSTRRQMGRLPSPAPWALETRASLETRHGIKLTVGGTRYAKIIGKRVFKSRRDGRKGARHAAKRNAWTSAPPCSAPAGLENQVAMVFAQERCFLPSGYFPLPPPVVGSFHRSGRGGGFRGESLRSFL